jgi:hypothetical protein
MRHPTLALAWELWHKNRRGNLAVLAAIPVCSVLYAVAARANGGKLPEDLIPAFLLPFIASMIWVIAVCSFTESDARRGFTGIPNRIFALPVRSSVVVTCLTCLGALVVAGLYLAWAGLVFTPAGLRLPVAYPTAALVTGYMFFQAVIWGLASFPWVRLFALVAGAISFIALNVVILDGHLGWARDETTKTLAMLAFLPLAYGAALFGVARERRGGWQWWSWLRRFLAGLPAFVPRRRSAFHSPASAQLWFEWRRKGWFVAGMLAVSLAGAVFFAPFAAFLDGSANSPFLACLGLLAYPILTAGTSGLGLGKTDFWSQGTRLRPFQALRPIPTADLVLAKLKGVSLIIPLGCLLAVPLTWAMTRMMPAWQDVWHDSGLAPKLLRWLPSNPAAASLTVTMALITAAGATWESIVEGVSLALTGRRRLILGRSILRWTEFFTLLFACVWFGFRPERLAAAAPVLILGSLLCLAAKTFQALVSFRRVGRSRLLSFRQLLAVGAVWLGLALSFGGFLLLLWRHNTISHPLLMIVTAWIWPGSALPRAFLNLDSDRHR